MILISFEDLQKIHNFSKLQGCGSKIGSATPIWISKFKRAWQAQFLSYNLETLEKWVFFEDVQMILVSFFHISTGFQLRKNAFKSSVHILRRPWVTILVLVSLASWFSPYKFFKVYTVFFYCCTFSEDKKTFFAASKFLFTISVFA